MRGVSEFAKSTIISKLSVNHAIKGAKKGKSHNDRAIARWMRLIVPGRLTLAKGAQIRAELMGSHAIAITQSIAAKPAAITQSKGSLQ